MGKVFSRFTMIVRRIKVSPEQMVTIEQNGRHQAIQRTEVSSVNNATDIRTSSITKHLPNEQGAVENDHGNDHTMVTEKLELETSQDVTENLGSDSVCDFSCHGDRVENAKTDWFDVTGNIRTDGTTNENASKTLQELSCSTKGEPRSTEESCVGRSQHYNPGNKNVFPRDDSHYEEPSFSHGESSLNNNCSSIPNNHQHEQGLHQVTSDDTLKGITGDGYSTEGTAGSEEGSFKDREDSNYSGNDAISEMFSKNVLVGERDDVKCDEKLLEMSAYPETPTLTSLSLETLNCVELDRRECVRSFIQAWEPTEISHMNGVETFPLTTTYQSPDNKTFDRNVLQFHDSPQYEDGDDENFFQLPEKVLKTPSNYWVDCRRERVSWSNVALPKDGEATLGRFGVSETDESESSWPRCVGWNDSSNRLTLCSLSTINEESDDEKRNNIDSNIIVDENK